MSVPGKKRKISGSFGPDSLNRSNNLLLTHNKPVSYIAKTHIVDVTKLLFQGRHEHDKG